MTPCCTLEKRCTMPRRHVPRATARGFVELGVMASWNASSLSPLDRAEQAEQPIDRRERMGRAPRNPQVHRQDVADAARDLRAPNERAPADGARAHGDYELDRKSTRLNSSHVSISYAVFCLKKKKNKQKTSRPAPPDILSDLIVT